jgi:heavy metal sensor kinase
VALYAFLFEAALLLGSFAAIDFFLWRSLHSELSRAAGREIHWLQDFIVDHEAGGRDFLLEEMSEHLGSRTGVALAVREGGEALFASAGLAGEELPGFLPITDGVYWVEQRDFHGFSLEAGVPAGAQIEARRSWRGVMALCALAGLVAAALLARTLARQAVGPLASIGEAAARVHDQNLAERIPRAARSYEEVERVRESFNGMLERLEDAVGKLRQFTADASHELRTPLSVLKVEAQTALASVDLEPAAAALVRSQLEEIDRLTSMVEDLLTLARMDSRSPELAPVDLADVLLETVEQFRPMAESHGVDLAVREVAPALLEGDRSQLRRLISNLLDNAVKYTERGGQVWVELSQTNGRLRFVVSDTGRGIPGSDIPRIFERFYRSDPSRSRRTGGAGLGLAIAARIVEFHRGEVSVTSEVGKGSSFVVDLPVAASYRVLTSAG